MVLQTCIISVLLVAYIQSPQFHSDLDISGDGKLSHGELEQALVDLDINITASQAHALVQFMGEYFLPMSMTPAPILKNILQTLL